MFTLEPVSLNESISMTLSEQNRYVDFLKEWGGCILFLVGVVLIITVMVWIVKIVRSHWKKPVNYLILTAISIFGVVLMIYGWNLAGVVEIARIGYYGCPNSKRIAKLNMKKRRKLSCM